MVLWVLFAILTAFVLTVLAMPLLRQRTEVSYSRASYDQSVYLDQLNEVQSDHERGLITETEASSARIEISKRLLAAADGQTEAGLSAGQTAKGESASKQMFPLMVFAICIPLLSVGVYLFYGAPNFSSLPVAVDPEMQNLSVQEVLAQAQERVKQNAEDGNAWDVLGPVYLKLKRYSDAANAFEHALKLKGEAAARYAGLGEALFWANGQHMTEPARKAFQRVLELEPNVQWVSERLAVKEKKNTQSQSPQNAENISQEQLIAMVEEGMAKNPMRVDGWDLIAPAYHKMRRYTDAAAAFQKAIKYRGETAARLYGYGDALLWANGQHMTEQARKAYIRALELDSKYHFARARLAGEQEQEGKIEFALKLWQEILQAANDDKNAKQWAEKNIERLKNAQAPKGPSAEDVKAAQNMSAEDRAAMIAGMVEKLSEKLAKQGGNIEEWKRLVNSYSVLGQKEKALQALANAKSNLKDDQAAQTQLDEFAKQLGLGS